MCVCVRVCVYKYVYIYKEREKERKRMTKAMRQNMNNWRNLVKGYMIAKELWHPITRRI